MTTRLSISYAFGQDHTIAIGCNDQAFKELVRKSVKVTQEALRRFESKKEKVKRGEAITPQMNLEDLMDEIGIFVEIIKNAVFLDFKFRTFQFDLETEEAIKEIFPTLHTWITAVGTADNDFLSRTSTQRAYIPDEMATYIKEHYGLKEK